MTRAWSSNDWPQQWVEPDGDPAEWHLRMSVVIPAFGRPDQLDVLLEALTQQTYPGHLTEIIVVDDGSDPALLPTIPAALQVKTLRQERDGFGLARARNLGVRSATGDVVIFLDADMIPETAWLEAHARPHHHHSPLATIGPRTHVSRLEVTMEEIRSGTLIQDLLADSQPEQPAWILERWETTNDGRIGDDIWWGTSGGNFGIDRQLFLDIGGYDEEGFREWGGEDNELGYRIYQSGAFIVPVHTAMAWHLGPATNDSPDIDERRRRIKILLASRVASDALPRARGLAFRAPDIAVEIVDPVGSFEEAMQHITAVLSDPTDASVRISLKCADGTDAALLEDYLASEPRVVLGPPDQGMATAPVTVRWESGMWPAGFATWLLVTIGESRSATLRIGGFAGTAVAWASRVLNQVESRLMTEAEAYERFGGRTLTWDAVLSDVADMTLSEGEEWRRRVGVAEAKLADVSSRRAVRWANHLGTLARARSLSEIRQALGSISRAPH